MWHWKLWFCHTINWPDILASLISKAHPADASWRNLGGAVGSHGIGTWRQGTVELHALSGVCPPLHRGRSSDETSNGEAVAGALGWGMTRVTNLGELGRLQKIWKAQFKNAQFESRYDQILYTSLFISLASRVYSLNSLNSVSPAFRCWFQ